MTCQRGSCKQMLCRPRVMSRKEFMYQGHHGMQLLLPLLVVTMSSHIDFLFTLGNAVNLTLLVLVCVNGNFVFK